MHASESFGNSSVNHPCCVRPAGALGHLLSKKLPGFLGENSKFGHVVSACGFLKVTRLFARREEKGIE